MTSSNTETGNSMEHAVWHAFAACTKTRYENERK